MRILTILFILISAAYSQAESNYKLTAVASVPSDGSIAVSSATNQGGEIVLLSPAQCEEIRRFSMDAPVNAIAHATAQPGFLWAATDSALMLISIDNGSIAYNDSVLAGSVITGIAQSTKGTYILVWGKNRATLLKYSAAGALVVWTKQLDSDINAAVVEESDGTAYLAGTDLDILDSSGGQLHRYALDAPLLSIALDPAQASLYMANGAGIIRYDIKRKVFTRLTSIPANIIRYTPGSDHIMALGGSSLNSFSYPNFKLLYVKPSDGEGMEQAGQTGALIYKNDKLEIYGAKSGNKTGSLYVSGSGAGFISANGTYHGNKNFMDGLAHAGGIASRAACTEIRTAAGSKTPPPTAPQTAGSTPTPAINPAVSTTPAVRDNQTVTAAVTAAADNQTATWQPATDYIPPVYRLPDNSSDNNSTATAVPPGRNPGISPSAGAEIPVTRTPSNTQEGVEIPVVIAPSVPTVPAPTVPVPTAPSVQAPVQATATQIPSWVINPADLPSFSTVATGTDDHIALNAGKLKIRDDVARSVMKIMLEDEFVKSLDDEVRKRLLWMVAGRAGQTAADYTMQTGKWVSPNRSHYILAQITENEVNQIFDPIFKEETDLLKSQGNNAYMAREVYKWP